LVGEGNSERTISSVFREGGIGNGGGEADTLGKKTGGGNGFLRGRNTSNQCKKNIRVGLRGVDQAIPWGGPWVKNRPV